MNRKNNRIKAQLADILLKEFNDPITWVREMTVNNTEPFMEEPLRSEICKLVRSRLDATKVIKLRLPLMSVRSKQPQNDPGIHVDLKLNGPVFEVKWKLAPNFGIHDWKMMRSCFQRLAEYERVFERIQDYIDVNYKQGDYSENLGKISKKKSSSTQLTLNQDGLVAEIKEIWSKYKEIPTQKEFALTVKDLPYSGILFGLRSGKIHTVEQGVYKTRTFC